MQAGVTQLSMQFYQSANNTLLNILVALRLRTTKSPCRRAREQDEDDVAGREQTKKIVESGRRMEKPYQASVDIKFLLTSS